MKRNSWKWVGLLMALSMLLTLAPAALAGPVELDPNINPPRPTYVMPEKFTAHMREPADIHVEQMVRESGRVPLDATPAEVEAATAEWYREFRSKNPNGADPIELKKRHDALNQFLLTGEPQAAAQTVEEKAALVAVVEFTGPDTITRLWPDPADPSICTEQTFTFEGPGFGETEPPGPLDNFHLWKPSWTAEDYEQLFFGEGPDAGIGIVRPDLGGIDLSGYTLMNYVLEQSSGTHRPQGDVLDQVLTLPHAHGWYGAGRAVQTDEGCQIVQFSDAHYIEYYIDAIAAMRAAYPDLDYSQFDTDGDRNVDLFAVIHADYDYQSSGDDDDLSTSSSSFTAHFGEPYQVAGEDTPADPSDDYFINGINVLPENLDTGAICEEYEHQFGLPDIYTTDGTANSNAWWGSHSSGVWGGPLGGTRPMGHNLWQDVFLGWRDPMVINYDDPQVELILGQARYTPEGTEDGLVINLPDKVVEETSPLGTGKALWSGNTDEHNSLLWREWDLSGATTDASFSVAAWWDIEDDWDYGYFEVSTDGTTWTSLPDMGGYMTDSNPNGTNIGWGLTGYGMDVLQWDLSAYVGEPMLYTRLNYKTDAAVHYTGWYVDDIAVTVDGTTVYTQDFEGDYSDWMNVDWIEVPFTATYPQAYFVEWRTKIGFDQSFDDSYYPVYNNDDTIEFQVDRTPYTTPVMQISFYDGSQDFDYALADSYGDPPSEGPKYPLLVVESHYWPYRFDTTFDWFQDGLVGYTVYGRSAAGDAGFGLVPTEEWTLRLGYDQDGNYTWPPVEEKTFTSQPAVPNFHDDLGYYPGFYYPGFGGYVYYHDSDASVVVPAEDVYTTRITWPDGTPFPELYGIPIGPGGLGDGNPGSNGVQYGVNLCVVGQGDDFGVVQFHSLKLDGASFTANPTEVVEGEEVEFALALSNLRGGASVFTFVPWEHLNNQLLVDTLTNGAFPIYSEWTSAQVAALFAEGGAEAVQALAVEGGGGNPIAGIGWIGNVPTGTNELFRFKMIPWWGGYPFDLKADVYLCGDLMTSVRSDEVQVRISGGPFEYRLWPQMDTFVSSVRPNANFADRPTFNVAQPDAARGLLYFETSWIPPLAVVDSATLKLYPLERNRERWMHLVAYPMEEWWWEGITWNEAPDSGDIPAGSAVLDSVNMEIELDITALVQQWISDPSTNHGLMLKGEEAEAVLYTFVASEHRIGEWPRLEIIVH